jgi:hypothetical protein
MKIRQILPLQKAGMTQDGRIGSSIQGLERRFLDCRSVTINLFRNRQSTSAVTVDGMQVAANDQNAMKSSAVSNPDCIGRRPRAEHTGVHGQASNLLLPSVREQKLLVGILTLQRTLGF